MTSIDKKEYTIEDLYALAEINIFPSQLGIFTLIDSVENYIGIDSLNLNLSKQQRN